MRELSSLDLRRPSGGSEPMAAAIQSLGIIFSAFGYGGAISATHILGASDRGSVNGATTAAVLSSIATHVRGEDASDPFDKRVSAQILLSLACGVGVGVVEGLGGAAAAHFRKGNN